VSTGYNIPSAQLPSIRPLILKDNVSGDKAQNYKIVKLLLPLLDQINLTFTRKTPPIKLSGDTITVMAIEGPHSIGISLNAGQQYIPVREGDILTREFSEFRVASFGSVPPLGVPIGTASDVERGSFTTITLAISYGRLIEQAFFKPGFTGQFPIGVGAAATTGTPIQSVFRGPENNVPSQILKYGGTMLLRNLDPLNSLFMYYGSGGDFNPAGSAVQPAGAGNPGTAWTIYPKELLQLDGRSRLSVSDRFGAGGGFTLCVAGENAAVNFAVMLSTWGDASDPDAQMIKGITSLEYDAGR
jgi:hypothetical protein